MSELASGHDDLPPMVRLVRREIAEYVTDVQGQIAPDVCPRWRDPSTVGKAELEKIFDATSALLQGCQQAAARYPAAVDE